MQYADMIQAYEKSVILGGANQLFPVEPSLTQAFARQIKMAMERAENAAYAGGYQAARRDMRKALGLK